MSVIKPGDMVRDKRGHVGIVRSKEPKPLLSRINHYLKRAEVIEPGAVDWWGVMSLHGGYLLWPAPFLERLRTASYEDFLIAREDIGAHAWGDLVELLPAYAERFLAEKKIKAKFIKPGAVVRDTHWQVGIVRERAAPPPKSWIDGLKNSEEVKKLGPTDWWSFLPLSGGSALSPGALLEYLRDATYEDFLKATAAANEAGRESLVKLFSEYVSRFLSEQRGE